MEELALYNDNKTLDKVLSEKSYATLSDIFDAYGIALESFNDYQPWYIENLLLEVITTESDLTEECGVDLENAKMQYGLLNGFDMEAQVQSLEGYVNTFENQAYKLNQLGYDWVNGNIEGFESSLDGIEDSKQEFQQELNDNRNIEMADKLDEILQEDSGQTYFVIVGTAHVVIEPSIPTKLEEKGYEVERVY